MTEKERLEKIKEILEQNCAKNGECIEWTGKLWGGYGTFMLFKKQWKAHRASYLVNSGDLPEGLYICHKCNNKKCINPLHLYAGTPKDNTRDMVNRKDYPLIVKKNTQIRRENLEERERNFANHLNSYLTVEEFAGILYIHPNTVLNGLKAGYYQGFRTGVGKRSSWRIPSSEVFRVAEFNTQGMIEEMVEAMIEKRLRDTVK